MGETEMRSGFKTLSAAASDDERSLSGLKRDGGKFSCFKWKLLNEISRAGSNM